jgi:hypothetical protein
MGIWLEGGFSLNSLEVKVKILGRSKGKDIKGE